MVALVLRPMLAAAAVPYAVVAFLFFSCWPRPDCRYLIGVFVFLPMLIVEGTFGTLDLIRLALAADGAREAGPRPRGRSRRRSACSARCVLRRRRARATLPCAYVPGRSP